MVDTTPIVVKPFQFIFDFRDNHCPQNVAGAAELAPDDLVDDVIDCTSDEAIRRLFEARAAADTAADIDRADACTQALNLLVHEDDCFCPDNAWQKSADQLDHLLDKLGDRLWAVSHNDEPEMDVYGPLRYTDLEERARWTQGWYRITAGWDGTRLTVTFGGDSGTYVTLTFQPLGADEYARYTTWMGLDEGKDDAASAVLVTPPAVFATAHTLFTATVDRDGWWPFDAWVAAVAAAETTTLSPETVEIIAGLADTWLSTLSDLVQTAPLLAQVAVPT